MNAEAAPVWVLLHLVEGPVNLGAVCRAMANTGFEALRFSGALEQDELEARKYAMHAGDLLRNAQKFEDLEPMVADLDCVFGFTPRNPWDDGRGLSLDGFHRQMVLAQQQGKRIGLLFGNEARGLENEHLVHCHFRVSLPTHSQYTSMNLAQAVLVVLWELSRAGGKVDELACPDPQRASTEDKRHMLGNLRGFLEAMAFLDPQNPEMVWGEFQQMFNSRDWTMRELNLLNGMLGKGRSRYQALCRKTQDGVLK